MITMQVIKKNFPQANIVELKEDEVKIVCGVFHVTIESDNGDEADDVFYLRIEIKPRTTSAYFTLSNRTFSSLEDACKEVRNFLAKQQKAIAKTLGE